MFLTCAKSKQLRRLGLTVAVGLAIGLMGAAPAYAQSKGKSAQGKQIEAPVPGAVTVSDYEFNTFAFPVPIKRVFFPGGSPVGQPIYLSDNMQVMLQFTKGADKPVQMVTELENGSVVTLRLAPRSVPGITHAVNGAKTRSGVSGLNDAGAGRVVNGAGGAATMPAPKAEDIELLKSIVTRGTAPDGFDPVKLPAPARFDKFSVIPLSGWTDGARRVLVFSLVAASGQTAVVSPPQFYRPGISAVMIDGDVVDENASPQLYVVEELQDE
jgi:hypothetical protein